MLFIIVISFLIQHRRRVALNSLHAKIRLRAYLRAGAVTGRRIVRMARMNLPRYVCILLHLSFLTTSRCRWSSPSRCTLLPGSRTGGIAQPLYLSSCFSRRAQAPPGGWEPLGAGVPAVCPSVLPLPSQLLLPGPLALGPPAENGERGITDVSLRVHQNWFA